MVGILRCDDAHRVSVGAVKWRAIGDRFRCVTVRQRLDQIAFNGRGAPDSFERTTARRVSCGDVAVVHRLVDVRTEHVGLSPGTDPAARVLRRSLFVRSKRFGMIEPVSEH